METAIVWYLVIGFVLILVGLSSSYFDKLPVTTAILYFIFGMVLGNHGFGFIHYDLIANASLFEHLTEVVVLVSLFSAGLKLRLPFRDSHWAACWRLATVSMLVTIALVAAFGYYVLHMPLGLCVLLGATLAPTDPVLASDVQVSHPDDRDRLRFSLTGEAGLNDGTAFPFVLLGLGLLGFHNIGEHGVRWLTVDFLWAGIGGLAVGWFLGSAVTKLVLKLREYNEETLILDDFLTIGLIALSYGFAHLLSTYGFLAVFAAGLSMRKIEKTPSGAPVNSSQEGPATMVKAVLSFTEQMERIGEVFIVILLGAAFNWHIFQNPDLIVIPVLLLLIRPISVLIGLGRLKMGYYRRPLIAWFGIRGIGTIYYVAFSIGQGLTSPHLERLTTIAYCTVVVSIFIHGISGLPFMNLYHRHRKKVKGLSAT